MLRFIKTSFLVALCAAVLVSCDLVNPVIDENQEDVLSEQSEAESFQLNDILSSENLGQIVGSDATEPETIIESGTSSVMKNLSIDDSKILSSNGYMDGTDLGRTNSSNTVGLLSVEDLIWNFDAGSEITSTPIKTPNDSGILFGDVSGKFYSLNIDTGEINWEFQANGPISTTPAISGNVVVFGSRDQNLYVLDADSGDLLWKFNAGGWIQSSPIIHEGVIYFGSYDGNLYALDILNGDIEWQYDAESVIAVAPSIGDGIIYFVSDSGILWALDLYTGRAKWNFKMYGDNPVLSEVVTETSTPIVLFDTVYVSGLGGIVYAIDGRTGQEQWAYKSDTLLSLNLSAFDGMVYLVELAGSVTSLDTTTGEKIWELDQFSAYNDPAFVCGDQVYFGTTDGTIHTVGSKTGEKNWEFKVLSGINTYPSVYDGILYVGSTDGHVYALKGALADSNPLQQ